jgi:hypothetical protein
MMTRPKLLLWSVFLLARSSEADALTKAKKPERPETKQACVATGGKWILYPMGRFYFCAIQTSDANKPCSDDSECQGDCIPVEHKAALPGVCASTLPFPGGCPKHVVNGNLILEPCI